MEGVGHGGERGGGQGGVWIYSQSDGKLLFLVTACLTCLLLIAWDTDGSLAAPRHRMIQVLSLFVKRSKLIFTAARVPRCFSRDRFASWWRDILFTPCPFILGHIPFPVFWSSRSLSWPLPAMSTATVILACTDRPLGPDLTSSCAMLMDNCKEPLPNGRLQTRGSPGTSTCARLTLSERFPDLLVFSWKTTITKIIR